MEDGAEQGGVPIKGLVPCHADFGSHNADKVLQACYYPARQQSHVQYVAMPNGVYD
jgi:hypothetical protein